MKTKSFVALARVSSREQEREGFSLDVQEEALQKFAAKNNGRITKFYKIAETASAREERKRFKELLEYTVANAHCIDGVLFYKVDRAARNIFDYCEIEKLERYHGVPAFYVAQPTENSPAGRMQRRILSNMASFYTEQQSVDVKEGLERRVKSGLFIGLAPYGYRNVRVESRGLIEVDPVHGKTVERIFELYAHHCQTLDSLSDRLKADGLIYCSGAPRFPRSKLHTILRDRAYIGEVNHHGQWLPGKHQPLVSRNTWDRVQALLGGKVYRSHEMVYAGMLIRCSHCGHPITGEVKTKKTATGIKAYTYYRCAKYTASGHPRVRVTEDDLDRQVLTLFQSVRIQSDDTRRWFGRVLKERFAQGRRAAEEAMVEQRRQLTNLEEQKTRLLNLRLADEIEADTFASKNREFMERADQLKLKIEVLERDLAESSDLVVRSFELSQSLSDKWITADHTEKRRLLEILCLNFSLDNVTLMATMRCPFDIFQKSLISKNGRGDRI